jgi:fatty-acyl-CoA synthase
LTSIRIFSVINDISIIFVAPGVHLLQQIPLTSSIDDVAARQNLLDADSPACIFFTSGTTGSPKAATLTHFAIVNEINHSWGTDIDNFYERICLPVPIYFSFGYINATMQIL